MERYYSLEPTGNLQADMIALQRIAYSTKEVQQYDTDADAWEALQIASERLRSSGDASEPSQLAEMHAVSRLITFYQSRY